MMLISHATQPDSVETIEDALANMCLSDTVTDYSTRPGVRVDAMKQLALEALPPVLILHLKRFSYDAEAGGTIKNHKVVGFGTELEIAPQWVSPAGRRHLPIKYSLSAGASRLPVVCDGAGQYADSRRTVVYHHGRQATGGHYTAAIRKQDGQWANLDDTLITDVGPADVAVDRTAEVLRLSLPSAHDGLPERSAYLLFLTRV
jgi:ubiquitin C-terminal hydrolase